jgi:acyl-CoA synthetase (AMP-forming)/AMP-acid ligase II
VLLHELVDAVAADTPDAPALIVSATGEAVTYGELSARVRRAAAVAAAATPHAGDRIAFIGENSAEWVDAYYGVPMAGRILTFLNHRLAQPEIDAIVRRSGAVFVDDWGADAPACEPARDPSAVAWLIYTSGTTGSPKGAMLTHASLLAASDATAASRPFADDDVYLFPFPLCHVAGYNVVNHHRRGRPVVLLPRFEPGAFVDATNRYRATTSSLAATMLRTLLDHLDATGETIPSLRTIAYGAAPMPAALLRRATDALGCDFAQGYGMTELSGNAVFLDADDHRRALAGDERLLVAAGRAAPGVELRIADDGEILVRAPQVTAGYWDDPEATAAALEPGGWFHTGDVGRLDDDGLLTIVDRKKDVIVTGGENVSSREVEEALHALPSVADVAVVGVPDATWGENVCAVVVRRDGDRDTTAGDVVDAVRGRLAGFKRPRHVVFVDDLPRNASGKILKHELRDWLVANPDLIGERA